MTDDGYSPAGTTGDDSRSPWPAVLDVVALLVLSGFAFYLTLKAGRRGFYPFDQSILFDGSYRVLSGQVPYRDFVLPFGPMAFWLHALFFKVLGVSYLSYIVGAAVINVVATLLSVIVVRLVLPSMRVLSYAGGLLTAVWFYPPFGTPWVDQTAFFFSFAALAVLLAAITRDREDFRKSGLLIGLSGCLAFSSFISKQNVAAFMFPVYPLLLVTVGIYDRRRLLKGLGVFLVGIVASVGCFMLWLYLKSDPATFVEYFFGVASDLGMERLAGFTRSWFGLLRPFFGGRGEPVINLMILGSVIIALGSLVMAIRRARTTGRGQVTRRRLIAAATCAYCVLFQHVFVNTTLNQPENALAFAGTSFAIAVGLLLGMTTEPGRPSARAKGVRLAVATEPGRLTAKAKGVRLAVAAIVVIVVALASQKGIEVSMNRKVHDIFRGSTFPRPVAVGGLKPLRWAEPTRMGGHEISAESIVRLYRYLKEQKQNFFIFPDLTLFYGLLDVPSPQPVLWFHRGVTYSSGANADLDRWIISELERNNVTIFILEQVSWFNTGERWSDFPRMKAHVKSNFIRVDQIGTFSIYQKKAAGS
ncbi:MAG: hypothetical protein ABIJ00_11320 [Candidatus Eisenbacteria bacterium]